MPDLSGWVIVGRHGGRAGRADKDGLGVDMGPVAEGCSSLGAPCTEDSWRALSLHCVFFYLRFRREHYVLATIWGKNSKYLREFGYWRFPGSNMCYIGLIASIQQYWECRKLSEWGLARRMLIILGEGAGFGGDAGTMAPSCFSLLWSSCPELSRPSPPSGPSYRLKQQDRLVSLLLTVSVVYQGISQ